MDADAAERWQSAQPYYDAVRETVRSLGGIVPEGLPHAFLEKARTHLQASAYHTFLADGSHFTALGNQVLAGLLLEHIGIFGG